MARAFPYLGESLIVEGGVGIEKSCTIGTVLRHAGSSAGFFGTAPTTKPTVSGSRGSNAALASLLTALAGLGLLVDSSS